MIVHGFGEHARRHAALAGAASAEGFDVWSFDQPGHGASPGPRAVVDGYGAALDALAALLHQAASGHADPPVLFGHSMGGAIALRFALDQPGLIRKLALSSPFLIDAIPRPAAQVSVARVLARILPKLPVAHPDDTRISRDPAEVERYRSDPLIHQGGVPAVTGITLRNEGEALLARASTLSVPTLVVHGTDDGYASVAGSRRLAALSRQVELIEMHDCYHELHHEPHGTGVPESVRERFLSWFAS